MVCCMLVAMAAVWWLPWLQVAVEEAVLVDNSLAVLVDLLNVLKQKKWVGPQYCGCGVV